MRVGLLWGLLWTSLTLVAEETPPWEAMNYGDWLASSVTLPWAKNGEALDGIVLKGITFTLGPVHATFDTGELRWAAATSGGNFRLMGTPFDGTHRPPENSRPALTGNVLLGSSHGPGWAVEGDWRDLRTEPYVPIPRNQAHYLGLVRADGRGVLHYSVGDAVVFEAPSSDIVGSTPALVRSIAVGPHQQPISLLVAEDRLDYRDHTAFDGRYPAADSLFAFLGKNAAFLDRLPKGARWKIITGTKLTLELPPSPSEEVITLTVGRVELNQRDQWHPKTEAAATKTVAALISAPRLADAKVGWNPRFDAAIPVPGRLGAASGPYVVDSLPMPNPNPWKAWMRPSGFDFFADGQSAAVCTWSGDVWLVSGLTGTLEKVTWKRLASGLFQPLGLKIRDGHVFVLCRDQIARLDDFNGDGEPDEIANFNNDVSVTPNFHEFALDLQSDSQGNFYFTKGGPLLGTEYWDPIGAHNGSVLKVSSDGLQLSRYATGLRAPNGSGMSPHDELVCSDNEGIWTPVCRLNWVRAGGFYGAMGMDHREVPPSAPDFPLCWLPYAVDNSSGSQVWTDPRFGPLGGSFIHLSYGKSRAFQVLTQSVGGTVQGGVVPLPWRFESSAMRGRSNPGDGSLWIAGLKGWQTSAANDGALHRVRWTGGEFPTVTGLTVHHNGLELRFNQAMDSKTLSDPGNWDAQWWNYHWSSQYGSDLYSVANPQQKTGKKGELKGDVVQIKSLQPGADGKSVQLEVDRIQPVMQIMVRANLQTGTGKPFPLEYYGTINAVPDMGR
jgi:hypothetical protein